MRPLRACYERLVERERLLSRLSRYEADRSGTREITALGLSEREVEVMQGVIGGESNIELGMSLGISRRTVERLAKEGVLPTVSVGAQAVRVRRDDLTEFVAALEVRSVRPRGELRLAPAGQDT